MIEVRIDDLAFVKGEAIVRPVNADLGATTPLLRRLEIAAGPRWCEQLRVQEPLPIGAAVVTGGGDLPVDLIVHAVVMSKTDPVSRDSVRRAMISALQRAIDWRLKDVAIAPFGLGAGNLDIEESAEIMLGVLTQHLTRARFPESVTFVAETPHEQEVMTAVARRSER